MRVPFIQNNHQLSKKKKISFAQPIYKCAQNAKLPHSTIFILIQDKIYSNIIPDNNNVYKSSMHKLQFNTNSGCLT